VAEGGGLLNRYRMSSPIVGSNPIPSASSLTTPYCSLVPAQKRWFSAVLAVPRFTSCERAWAHTANCAHAGPDHTPGISGCNFHPQKENFMHASSCASKQKGPGMRSRAPWQRPLWALRRLEPRGHRGPYGSQILPGGDDLRIGRGGGGEQRWLGSGPINLLMRRGRV
jgi:hypothetical protein